MMDSTTSDLAVRVARAEIERDDALRKYKELSNSYMAMMQGDKEKLLDTLHIIGIPARELTDIYGIVQKWERNGGSPKMLDLYRELAKLHHELEEVRGMREP